MNPTEFDYCEVMRQRNNTDISYGDASSSTDSNNVQRILRRTKCIFWIFMGGALLAIALVLLAAFWLKP